MGLPNTDGVHDRNYIMSVAGNQNGRTLPAKKPQDAAGTAATGYFVFKNSRPALIAISISAGVNSVAAGSPLRV